MKRSVTILLLTAVLFFTNGFQVFASQVFKDVNDNYLAKTEIEYLVTEGIVSGYPDGNYGVDDHITRLQASVMIIRALHLDMSNRPDPNFEDIEIDDPNYSIIATIADAGIMSGNEKKQFKPSDTLTRAQMAIILMKAFDLKDTSSYSFRDVADTHWASIAIKTLYENKITSGYADNTYQPNNPITRAHFAMFLAKVLNPQFKQAQTCQQLNNTEKQIVNVPVTTLWKSPNKTRVIDKPSISNPTNLSLWTKEMNYGQKLDLVGKIDTQALYGQEVTILQSSGDWYKIAVQDQYNPNNSDGYPGWVPKSHIIKYYPNYADCNIAIISANKANLYNDQNTNNQALELSFNTILPVIKEGENWVQVQTPKNEVKYLRKEDVKIFENYESIPKPTKNDLVQTSKAFLNIPYLWAGNSAFGFDCSGFMYSIYKQHGILIPRDSTVQAKQGTPVLFADLQPGDLMFYAHNKGKGTVHHVSMYIGDGKMIHSPNTATPIEITSIHKEQYKSEFSGARRYLK